jgi:glutaryl-CoA dehydrogenase
MSNTFINSYRNFDYLQLDDFLSNEQILIRNSVQQFVNKEILPIIDDCAQNNMFPKQLLTSLSEHFAFGAMIPKKYGGAELDAISYGIIMQELERGDSAIRSCASVQSSLVMYPIFQFGSEEQKEKFLPKLAKAELIGCFGLTEPNHGSDPASMETRLIKNGDKYILNGTKMWITNAPIADIAIVWAKNENNHVVGCIVEKGMQGFSTNEIKNKWSLRASITGELIFDNIELDEKNILPLAKGLKAPLSCLSSARYGISWGALGATMDCIHTAIEYSKQRKQFGKPLAKFQLTQKKLAELYTELVKAQLLALRVGQLYNEKKVTPAQISMAKRNNVELAIRTARECRQICGAMGILGDFPFMRHAMNLESVITYEGTHEVHLLITGMDITGENAFE